VFEGALLSQAHPGFDLCEDLLDRVAVWWIGRQIPEPCAGSLDGLPDSSGRVAPEIGHDDDVVRLGSGDKLLLDVGAKGLAVDRAVEDARGGQPVATQGAEEGERAPVAVRREGAEPIALWSPSSQRGHIGLDPGLID